MIGYLARDTIGKAILALFSVLNLGIYKLVRSTFSLIINVSKVTFDDTLLGNFETRMYIVIAIYMLFRLAFSLISSIVNPEKLLDKQTGMQKIIPRTIISLAMLIMMPTIFSFAIDAQNTIVAFVPRVILGKEVDTSDSGVLDTAESIAAMALSAFITLNPGCTANGVTEDSPEVDVQVSVGTIWEAIDMASEQCDGQRKVFKYEFSFLVSLVVGIVLVVVLLSYSVDVSVRTIKLGLLQILSPIPVISYIDPKSEKSGAFGNWLKECISTYTELFIKLGVLYFALFLLGNLSSSSVSLFNIPNGGLMVRTMLIIGVFMFMGSAAEFICNIIGIKYNKGSGGLFKGLAGIGAAVGIGAATLSAARTNYRGNLKSQEARGKQPNKGKAIASAIMGGFVGAGTASHAAATSKGNKWSATQNAINKRNGAYMKAANDGATFGGKAGAYIQQAFTGETAADRMEREIADMERANSETSAKATALKNLVSHADDKAKTSTKTIGFSQYGTKTVTGNYHDWTMAFNAAKSTGSAGFEFNNGFTTEYYTMEEAEQLDFGLLKSNSENYLRRYKEWNDAEMESLISEAGAVAGLTVEGNTKRGDIKDQIDQLIADQNRQSGEISRLKDSDELRKAKANRDAAIPK